MGGKHLFDRFDLEFSSQFDLQPRIYSSTKTLVLDSSLEILRHVYRNKPVVTSVLRLKMGSMQTASKRESKYETEELRAALQAETQLRLEAEDNLRRACEDFDNFLLIAAHDLREPLRTVNAYCELLAG